MCVDVLESHLFYKAIQRTKTKKKQSSNPKSTIHCVRQTTLNIMGHTQSKREREKRRRRNQIMKPNQIKATKKSTTNCEQTEE